MKPRATRLHLLDAAAVAGVAALAALLTVPWTLARWWLTQDAVEHLAIAHAWVHGAGFVDPVQWTYLVAGTLPYPALAMRAPAVSLLAAIPLALGATLAGAIALHALWASAVAAAVFPAARRCGARRPAALAAALLFSTTPAWLVLSRYVWTEATALLAFLLVLLTARGAVRSVPAALRCAGATWLASLCRPNLVALAAAVALAGAWQIGWRSARRSRPLIAYAAALAAALLGFRVLATLWTGEAPYSRYRALFQVLTTSDAWHYARSYPGPWAFAVEHAPELFDRTLATLAAFARVLLVEPTYHWLGWLALPGFTWALARGGEHALERRFAALSGLGLAAIASLYLDFDRIRFPLFTAVAAAVCGLAWLDDVARRALRAPAGAGDARRRASRWAPLALACIPLLATLPESFARSAQWWRAYRSHGTLGVLWPRTDALLRPLCREMDPDAIVASIDPWTTHLWCGNAALMLPRDLDRPDRLERFLAHEHPGYLVAPASDRLLRESPRLHPLTERAGVVVYQVSEAPASSRPWRAPPPLACAGRPPACLRALGR